MISDLSFYKGLTHKHGLRNTLFYLSLKAVNKVAYTKVLTCIIAKKAHPASLLVDPKFNHKFLENDELILYSKDKSNELPIRFLKSAMLKGDKCYAIIDQGEVAGYGWYSNKETTTDIKKLTFSFDPTYAYMYKGLTKKNYRGQRLHAIGMSWALQRQLEMGAKGLVSYVEAENFDSLKSCYRMGYKKVGTIIVINMFGKNFLYHTKSCKKHNIRLK